MSQYSENNPDISQLMTLLEAGYSVLTPNFRMSRSLSAHWDGLQLQRGRRAWGTPNIFPAESWLQEQWQSAVRSGAAPALTPLASGQQLELWQEVVASCEHDSLGYNLIRPVAAAAQACKARDTLLRWQVDINQPRFQALFELDEDCASYLHWQARFCQRLDDLDLTTPSDSLACLLRCAKNLPKTNLVLVGFDDMAPLLRCCVETLADELIELGGTGQLGQCRAYEFPDKRSELAAVALWARNHHQSNSNASIGIIVPDMATDRSTLEYLLRREFDALGENYTSLPINFSTGLTLDQVSLVRDALLVLGMSTGRGPVAINDVVRLWRSRFLKLDDIDTPLAMRFLKGLFDTACATVSAADLRYRASRSLPHTVESGSGAPDCEGLLLGQILLEISTWRDLHTSVLPSQWAEHFSSILELWGWPGKGPLDSIEYQQLQLWFTLLDEFAGYDSIYQRISYDEALGLLSRCCTRQVSQPQTPDSNIQVLGLLEAAGLEFDQLWICDMQASTWPAAARPNPFIPIRLQRELAMPNASAQREWMFASRLMSRYQRSAPTVIASYARQNDGVVEKPSALLEGFDWQEAPETDTLNRAWIKSQNEASREILQDDTAPAVSASEIARLGGGSGLLEDQSHCPFRAFAKRRLGIKPLTEAGIGLSAAERGSLLHDALYRLWGVLEGSATLAALSAGDVQGATESAVRNAVDALPAGRRGGMGHAYFELETLRLQGLLMEWLEVERQRSEFVVLAREEELTIKIEQLQLSLRVDRIDQLADGARFVIDYKSGRSSANDWLGERPAKPQLLLYGIAITEPVAGLAFAQLRPRDCKYVGAGQTEVASGIQTDIEKLVKDKMQVKDWEDLSAQWEENLQRLVKEFIAGVAQVDPLRDSSCSYCGLQALCRVAHS